MDGPEYAPPTRTPLRVLGGGIVWIPECPSTRAPAFTIIIMCVVTVNIITTVASPLQSEANSVHVSIMLQVERRS